MKIQYARFQVVRSLGVDGPELRSSPWRKDPVDLPVPHYHYSNPDNKITDRVVQRTVSWWRWLLNDNRGDA